MKTGGSTEVGFLYNTPKFFSKDGLAAEPFLRKEKKFAESLKALSLEYQGSVVIPVRGEGNRPVHPTGKRKVKITAEKRIKKEKQYGQIWDMAERQI